MEQPQTFALFLRACFKKVFDDDGTVTAEALKDELFRDEPLNNVRGLFGVCCTLLRQGAQEGELTEDVLGKSRLSAAQQDVMSRFWVQQKDAAHKILVERSRGKSGRLESFEWRVDSKQLGDRNESTAIVALQTDGETLHFEMNAQQLQDVIATLSEVKTVLEERTK
jgi:hypothetical protein